MYIQFNKQLRIELAILLTAGKNQTQCAKILGISRPNVNLEIQRNKDTDGVYRGASAHKRYLERRKISKEKYRKIENDKILRKYILVKIKQYWSPEQIAGRARKQKGLIISHETVYQYIYTERKDLIKYLRHGKCKYRRKRGSMARIKQNKASKIRKIEERPSVVDERSRVGDWENDTVIGKEKKKRILTFTERKSGFGIAKKLNIVRAETLHSVEVSVFKKIPKSKRLTLTRDNGSEFGDLDQDLEKKTKMKVYRAHAYSSHERGTNENWNGLLRQFFPKGMLFDTLKQYEIDKVVNLLNDRPRKRLGYSTPREIFRCISSD